MELKHLPAHGNPNFLHGGPLLSEARPSAHLKFLQGHPSSDRRTERLSGLLGLYRSPESRPFCGGWGTVGVSFLGFWQRGGGTKFLNRRMQFPKHDCLTDMVFTLGSWRTPVTFKWNKLGASNTQTGTRYGDANRYTVANAS